MDELFQTMADANLVEVYPDKLVDIHSHTRDDILEFLAPSTIHTERDIDDRCKVLSDLKRRGSPPPVGNENIHFCILLYTVLWRLYRRVLVLL